MASIDEISRMLADRAMDVATMLLPQGKRINGHLAVGDASGSPGKSLQVNLAGPHVGKWRDWSGTDRGDLLDLWASVRSITLPEAFQQAGEWLGVPRSVCVAQQKTYTGKPRENEAASESGRIRKYLREERKLADATIEQFRIRTHVRGEGNERKGFIVYPSYDPNGNLVNNCYIGLDRDEKGKKIVWQDTGCAPCLFGWHALGARAFESRTVIICEGQIDCMTWTQWGFDCLSIPNGGGNTWIDYEWENLEVFKTIYLSYDMDGKLSDTQAVALARLGKHRCRLIHMPHKDANAALQAGAISEDAKEWVQSAKNPKLNNFATTGDLRARIVEHFFPTDTGKALIQPACLKGPHPDRTFTVRPGELSVWTGIASHGKSSLLAQVFMEMVLQQQIAMIISLEMKPERVVRKMALCFAGPGRLTHADVHEFVDTINERVCFLDKVGSVAENELIEVMRFAFCRYGATQFLIDSLMRVEGLEEDYKAQGKFMNRLCTFAAEYGAHVHLVAHPRKTTDDSRPSANDLKGSSLMRNNADNVMIVYRNLDKERKFAEGEITEEEFTAQWDTAVTVEKDREQGTLKSYKYKYSKESERFTQMVVEPKTRPFRDDPRKKRRDA